MTLNHSKTWPISNAAALTMVQLRVDANGRTYSTHLDNLVMDHDETLADSHRRRCSRDAGAALNEAEAEEENGSGESMKSGTLQTLHFPLTEQHVELLTRCYRTTIRTDTVSTILEPENHPLQDDDYEKIHVLALSRIDEDGEPSQTKLENWELIYAEQKPPLLSINNEQRHPPKVCPACNKLQLHSEKLIVPELPLDARKTTTLRRHYYPEGGWGWVIIVCTMLVHILNVGLQLSCSQLVLPGAEKFKTRSVHIAGK